MRNYIFAKCWLPGCGRRCHTAFAELLRIFDYRVMALVVALLSFTATDAFALLGSTTTVISSANPSAFGEPVTFTTTVSGLVITPTGTATFMDGVSQIGTVLLDGSGRATLTTSALSAGSHVVTVLYSGDVLYNTSSSSPFSQIVAQNSSATIVSSSLNPSGLTQPVTFTATVSCGSTPGGSVTFMDGPTALGTGTLDGGGQATFTTSLLLPGSRSITAVYGGGGNCASSTSSPVIQIVNVLPTTTSVISSDNPSALGQSVTFTASVSGLIITPTGTVTFMDGATILGTGSLNGSGQATFNTNALAAGNHSITAIFGGDLVYAGSASSVLTQSVNQNSSTVSVASSLNPSNLTQGITFTAIVTSSGGIPTGIVNFKDGSTALGTGTLDGAGRATFTTSLLLPGSHSITAAYAGDSGFAASTSSVLIQVVNLLPSVTTVSSSGNPSAVGQTVTFTATVAGLIITPTGIVTFMDGGTTLGTGALTGNQAVFSTSALVGGGHSITAIYSGDSIYASSTSAPLTQSVNPNSSIANIGSSINPSALGQPVIFTAMVTSSSGNPTGTVSFKDGSVVLGTGTLDGSGKATLATSALAAGSHPITAVYAGDANFAASASSPLIQVVNSIQSTTSIASSANPSAQGQPITFTATVAGLIVTPTGSVTFKDGTATLGTSSLNGSGQATFTTSTLTGGNHPITALYSGDAAYGVSASSSLIQIVNISSSSTNIISSVNPSAPGQAIVFTANVSTPSGTPTGTVTFKDGSTTLGTATLGGGGQATLATSVLTAGTHTVTALYSGDADFGSSTSSPLIQIVNMLPSVTTLGASPNPSVPGQLVTFVASVAGSGSIPTGTVTFKDGSTVLGDGTLNGAAQATFTTGALAGGSHAIIAIYGGDSAYGGSSSSPIAQVVNHNSSDITLVSSMSPSTLGQPITFTAAVAASGGTPTGAIIFKDGSVSLGSAALDGSGRAALTTAALAVGGHSITAVYAGDSNFSGATSPPVLQVVNQSSSTTTLSSSANPSKHGESVTFTAMVIGASGSPTGSVSFNDGATTLGSGVLDGSGRVTFSISSLSIGRHSIAAVYAGDSQFRSSKSPVLVQAVDTPTDSANLRNAQVLITKIEAQSSGQSFSASVDRAIAEGFSDGGEWVTPGSDGIRLNFSDEAPANSRVADAFGVIEKHSGATTTQPQRFPKEWFMWADVRGTGWATNPSKGDIGGGQLNTMAGITRKLAPNLLAGILAGYERFNYSALSFASRLSGDGWTVGGYLGWRPVQGITMTAAIARSSVGYDGTSGAATGSFYASRWIVSTALIGQYKMSRDVEIEPSVRAFMLWENDGGYTDSLGTAQDVRKFSTGRASIGSKALYRWLHTSTFSVTPYVGFYGDYYFTEDDAAVQSAFPELLRGMSGRVTSGISVTQAGGAHVTLEGELGGIGSGGFTVLSTRARAMTPF